MGRLEAIPFVGRAAELRVLSALAADAGAGRCGAVLVRGEAGIGKSALLREVCRSPTLPGPTVRWLGRCEPRHRALAYGALSEVLRLPQGVAVEPERLLEALHGRTGAAALLALDDAHWADDATLELLAGEVAGRDAGGFGLVLATRRLHVPEALLSVVARLSARGLVAELELGPMDQDDTRALAAALLGRAVDPVTQPRVELARGNPLQLKDILTGRRPVAPPRPRLPSLPDGLGQGVVPARAPALAGVASLGRPARDLLGMAALLGVRFAVRDLCLVVGRTMTELLPDVREALATGLLADAGEDCLAFRQEEVRRALCDELPASVRSELHRDLADRLDESGAPLTEVADHLLLATTRTTDLDRLASVAERVLPLSPEAAVSLWRRHRAVVPPDDPRLSHTEAGLATAQLAAGDPGLAEVTARRALASGVSPGAAGALQLSLTTCLLWQGRWAAARATAESAAEAEAVYPWERAEQTALAATASLCAGDTDAALEAARRAERAAESCGAHRARLRVRTVTGRVAHAQGRLEEARLLLEEAARLTVADGGREALDAGALPLRAALLADLDRLPEALAQLDRCEDLARARGARGALTATLEARAGLLLDRGALPEAARAVEARLGLEDDELIGPGLVLAARRAAVALHVDGPEAAEKWLARLPDDLDATGRAPGVAWLFRARALDLYLRGEPALWTAQLQHGWETLCRADLRVELVLIGPELAEALARAGDRTGAAAVARTLEEVALGAPQVTTLQAAALTARGVADGSAQVLGQAVRAWQDSPRRLHAARVAELVAGRLLRLRRKRSSDELSAEAVRGYVECGATYDAQRLREERRSRPEPPVVPPQPTRDGWETLTPTERVVAGHVELGESNAEIARRMVVSRRTVETHVSHILAKLRLRSRSELVIAALQNGRMADQQAPATRR